MRTPNPIEQKATKRTKACLPLCFLCLLLLNTSTLPAEEVVIESDLSVEGDVEIDETLTIHGDDGVLFLGDGPLDLFTPGAGSIPVEGAGTRFMWYPGKAAFRAGWATGTQWDDSDIGNFSMAFGYSTRASGYASTAMGMSSVATGDSSTAMGESTSALGWASTAMGIFANASGYESTAMGSFSSALGYYSTAMGDVSSATGNASTAMGSVTIASGDVATAMGYLTIADGYFSTAMGENTAADSRSSVAIGRYNIGGGHPTQWDPEDPLFEIGNGTGDSQDPPEVQNSNALTVYKSGDAEFSGTVRVQPSGDISMGQFTD